MNETKLEPTTIRATVREVAGGPRHRLQVRMANSVDEVHAAQRLRHRVFAGNWARGWPARATATRISSMRGASI